MNIVIIGDGGHSKVIRELILSLGNHRVIGCLDDKYQEISEQDNFILGPVSAVHFLKKKDPTTKFIFGIGNNHTRKKLKEVLNLPDKDYISLLHPTACVSSSARIGSGTVIMAHAVIQADAKIGSHTIINTSAIIEHDNIVGDFAHISPNAVLTGCVKIGVGVHIGAGATVIPGKKIGEWSTIGAGAAVTVDLPGQCTAVGIPAQIINHQVTGGV